MRINILFCLVLLLGCEPALVQTEVPLTHSKEFQIVLKNDDFLSRTQGKQRVIDLLQAIEDTEENDFKYKVGSGDVWDRHVRIYDTNKGRLKASNLVLQVEHKTVAGNLRSKLKLKYNCMDADVCYDTQQQITEAFPYPARRYESVGKIKLEADIHQNYTKYALSSAIKVVGAVAFATVGEATRYFKRLGHLKGISSREALIVVGDYYEWVFDDLKLKVNGDRVRGALVVRYAKTDLTTPIRVEFSLKIKKPKDGWHYDTLVELGQVYYELLQSDMNFFKGRIKPGQFYLPADLD
jgi:antitoxin component of MazEF toxin-antitoxin module